MGRYGPLAVEQVRRAAPLDALAIVAEQYDLERLRPANVWEPAAVAMLVEAVDGLALETQARRARLAPSGRPAHVGLPTEPRRRLDP
jgi:hypothetical protein